MQLKKPANIKIKPNQTKPNKTKPVKPPQTQHINYHILYNIYGIYNYTYLYWLTWDVMQLNKSYNIKSGTSGLLAFGCPTEPSTPDYNIYIYI